MRRILLLLAILMFPLNVTAHEVKPPPMEEACAVAKWLREADNRANGRLFSRENSAYWDMYTSAVSECERYQEQAIDWAEFERDVDAAIERAAKAVTKCE